MKPILLPLLIIAGLNSPAQSFTAQTTNNVLSFKYANGTPIPSQDGIVMPKKDSIRLALFINHQATLKYLLAVKKRCKKMGLYLNYRTLVFDQEQKLEAITLEYALKHANVCVAVAAELRDTTRFGVFGSVTQDTYRYYVGYQRN